MSVEILLLRGVNVGGKGKLPMADLRGLLEGLGAAEPKSYVQSGNAVYRGRLTPGAIADAVEAAHGFRPTVMTRAATRWRKLVAEAPFAEVEDLKMRHVFFTEGAPKATEAELLAAAHPDEKVRIERDAIHLLAPRYLSGSRLAPRLERLAGVPLTARNWRTVLALHDMAGRWPRARFDTSSRAGSSAPQRPPEAQMTVTLAQLALYAWALLVLFLTPGPVWVALLARALSGGFNAAWPLAMGVVVGDMLWPFLAILGVTWLVSVFSGFLVVLKGVAAVVFLAMGLLLLRRPDTMLGTDGRLTRPGMWAGFAAGLVVILGNPKAILFYMGILPGFFDLASLTPPDVAAIVALSALVPLSGNLCLALSINQVRRLLSSPRAVRRTNIVAGCMMLFVAAVIPFT